MNSPRIAFILPSFNSQRHGQRIAFLKKLNDTVKEQSIVITDSKEDESLFPNLILVRIVHSRDLTYNFRIGLNAALSMGVEKIVTFEDYSVENVPWFLDYLNGGNIIESRKRNFREMLVTELSNILSFGNSYNKFSFNRIFTAEAAKILADKKLNSKSFMVESINLLNTNGISTTEIIRRDYGKDKKKIDKAEMLQSIIRSFNRSSINYSLISSLSYLVNIMMVYTSLSIGFFYPLAVLIGGEISGISNFIVNEKLNFKNKGFLNSAYRFGKFNAFVLAVIAFDIFLIGFISKYLVSIGRTDFAVISTFLMITVSSVSLFATNKIIWTKGNHKRIFV